MLIFETNNNYSLWMKLSMNKSKNVIKIFISYGKFVISEKSHPSKVFMLHKRDFICSNLCREIIVK